MIGPTKGGERNSVPASAYWSVNVSKKEVFNVGKIAHDLLNALCVFPKTDPVQRWNTNLKWRMMHEKINGSTSGFFQLRPLAMHLVFHNKIPNAFHAQLCPAAESVPSWSF